MFILQRRQSLHPGALALALWGCGQQASVVPATSEPEACETMGAEVPRQLRLLSRREYSATIRQLFGWTDAEPAADDDGAATLLESIEARMPVESQPESFPFDNAAPSGLVDETSAQVLLDASYDIALAALDHPRAWLDCEDLEDEACAALFLDTQAPRIFRRPLLEEERARFEAVLLGSADLEDGLEVVLTAMLASPSFLYRDETGTLDASGVSVFDGWQRASALSYLLWGTMPDELLFEAAAAGALDSAPGLDTQARRMLADPRARSQLADFATMWLQVGGVLVAEKDAELMTPQRRRALYDEPGDFVSWLAFSGAGTVEELMVSPVTVGGEQLARHYDIPTRAGRSKGPLDLEGTGRRGLLGMAAVQAVNAHSDQSSPVMRGVWIREALLCQALPVDAPNAGATPSVDSSTTTRDRFEQHTADPACASCHRFIDGPGFALEPFDHLGLARTHDNGHPIDPSGELEGLEELYDGTSASFSDLDELAFLIAGSDRFGACFTRQLHRFAVGRDVEESCAVDRIAAAAEDQDWDIQALMLEVVAEPSFWSRSP